MPLEFNDESAVSRYRNASTQLLAGLAVPREFENPEEGRGVRAAEFLHHVNLDTPQIGRVLKQAYPYFDHVPGLKQEVHARVRFIAWMTLRGFNRLASAHRALLHDLDAQQVLGFHEGLPCYDTLREFIHERLSGCVLDQLLTELLVEQRRLLPDLGTIQVQDATPLEARRRDDEAPYNLHYGVRMMKNELRWDVPHEALLTQQYYDGLAHEGQWLTPLTLRLVEAGIQPANATVDGGYTSFHNIARQWRHGVVLSYCAQEGWKPDRDAALADVLKRYQTHREKPSFLVEASLDAKLRFLVDHGSEHDINAVGCYLRDNYLATRSIEEDAHVKSHRSQNEGLNAEYKRLPITPARRGKQELLRRAQACSLTLHLVQLCRLQHGITTHLCRTAYFL